MSSGPSNQSKYVGGEQRVDAGGSSAYVAIAAEAAGANNLKECVAMLVLQRILGEN